MTFSRRPELIIQRGVPSDKSATELDARDPYSPDEDIRFTIARGKLRKIRDILALLRFHRVNLDLDNNGRVTGIVDLGEEIIGSKGSVD